MSPHAESPSQNEPSERDTLSETRPIGKLGTSGKISDPIWVQEGVRCIRKRSARGFSGSTPERPIRPRRLQEPAAFPEQGQPLCLAQAGGGGRADRPRDARPDAHGASKLFAGDAKTDERGDPQAHGCRRRPVVDIRHRSAHGIRAGHIHRHSRLREPRQARQAPSARTPVRARLPLPEAKGPRFPRRDG